MLAIENSFGFGQATPSPPVTPTPVPAPTTPTEPDRRNVLLPAVPDNTVVRCKFDPVINGLRCAPVQLLEPPTVFLLAAGGLAAILLGYALGRAQFLPRFAERVAEEPLRGRYRRRR